MANTRIQIRRSTTTTTPPGSSLTIAEQAYSYSSNTLFIGGSDGVGVLPIGGKFYVDQQSVIFGVSNAAYFAANSGTLGTNTFALNIGTAGNNYASILSANLAAAINANASFSYTSINSYATTVGTAGNNYASILVANTAAAINANVVTVAASVNSYAQQVGAAANAYTLTNYVKYSNVGTQLITSDVAISGNLTITGQTTFANTQQLQVGDNVITLNADLPPTVAPTENAGIEVNRGNKNSNAALWWIESTGQWGFTSNDWLSTTTFIASNTLVETYAAAINANASVSYTSTNNYTVSVGVAGNNYASILVANVAAAINANTFFANFAINAYAQQVGTAGNNYASILVANTGAAINANATVSYASINSYVQTVATAGNTTVRTVTYGGTGNTTFTANGILFGNGTGPIQVTAAGTDGQVLQVAGGGIPSFGMLDGGTF